MWLDCFITFDSQTSIFKILLSDKDDGQPSDGAARVQLGVERLRTALCECATRDSTPFEIYLAELAPAVVARKEVRVIDVTSESSNSADGTFGASAGGRPGLYRHILETTGTRVGEHEQRAWEEERSKRANNNRKIMKQTARRALSRLVFYRGRVQLRVRIGSFIFTRHFWTPQAERMPIDEVLKHLQDPNTRGEMQQR